MAEKGLTEYRQKRDFRRTNEPQGGGSVPGDRPIFVIQKHAASNLHYDLRIEVNGVLRSWAVPKGPSTDPRVKRLAIPTEDHPLEYADFEGTIPEDEYGGGKVIVWDRGHYRNLKEDEDIADSLDQGHATLWLEGSKLKGGYALIKTKRDDNWLLVKMDDEEADARRNPTSTEPRSVLSGRTVDEVGGDE